MEKATLNSAPSPFLFSSGPAGAMTGAILKLVTIQSELQMANMEYAKTNTQLTSAMGTAAALSDIAAGNAQANATICQAIQTGVGAGLTMAAAGVTYLQNKADSIKQDAQQTNLTEAEKFRSELLKPADVAAQDPALLQHQQAANDPVAVARITELQGPQFDGKVGTFTTTNAHLDSTTDIPHINPKTNAPYTPKEVDEAAIAKLNTAGMETEKAALLKQLESHIDVQTKAVNTLATGISSRQAKYHQYEQIGTQLANAAGSGAQSIYQREQGVAQAGAAGAQSVAQQASSMLSTNNSTVDATKQTIRSLLEILTSMSRAYTN